MGLPEGVAAADECHRLPIIHVHPGKGVPGGEDSGDAAAAAGDVDDDDFDGRCVDDDAVDGVDYDEHEDEDDDGVDEDDYEDEDEDADASDAGAT